MLKSRNSGKFNMVFKFKAKYGYFKEENINADVKNTNYSAKKQAREL